MDYSYIRIYTSTIIFLLYKGLKMRTKLLGLFISLFILTGCIRIGTEVKLVTYREDLGFKYDVFKNRANRALEQMNYRGKIAPWNKKYNFSGSKLKNLYIYIGGKTDLFKGNKDLIIKSVSTRPKITNNNDENIINVIVALSILSKVDNHQEHRNIIFNKFKKYIPVILKKCKKYAKSLKKAKAYNIFEKEIVVDDIKYRLSINNNNEVWFTADPNFRYITKGLDY